MRVILVSLLVVLVMELIDSRATLDGSNDEALDELETLLEKMIKKQETSVREGNERLAVLQEMLEASSEVNELEGRQAFQTDPTVIVSTHNKLRRTIGASNMYKITWDTTLANRAQGWANGCSGQHSASVKEQIGENIARGDIYKDYEMVMDAWWAEQSDYNINGDVNVNAACAPGKQCGHFTAMAEANTYSIGCGSAKCSFGQFAVCNYFPSGNYPGTKPYISGPSCSACKFGKENCDNGLCEKGARSESHLAAKLENLLELLEEE